MPIEIVPNLVRNVTVELSVLDWRCGTGGGRPRGGIGGLSAVCWPPLGDWGLCGDDAGVVDDVGVAADVCKGTFNCCCCCCWSRNSFCFCKKLICGVLKLPPDMLLPMESCLELRRCDSGEELCELIGDASVRSLPAFGEPNVCCKFSDNNYVFCELVWYVLRFWFAFGEGDRDHRDYLRGNTTLTVTLIDSS